jgi:hypothetical protein
MEIKPDTAINLTVGDLQTIVGWAIARTDMFVMQADEVRVAQADRGADFQVAFFQGLERDKPIANLTIPKSDVDAYYNERRKRDIPKLLENVDTLIDEQRGNLLTAAEELRGMAADAADVVHELLEQAAETMTECASELDILETEVEAWRNDRYYGE